MRQNINLSEVIKHPFFSDWLNRSVMFLNKREADDFDGVDNKDAFVNVGN